MTEKVQERREALIKHFQELSAQHQQAIAQQQQLGIALERVRGAIALCDELLGPAESDSAVVSPNGVQADASA